jgi:hypothetical protein
VPEEADVKLTNNGAVYPIEQTLLEAGIVRRTLITVFY